MARLSIEALKQRVTTFLQMYAPGAKLEEDEPGFAERFVWQAVAPPGSYWWDSNGHHLVLTAANWADLAVQVETLIERIRLGVYRPDAETWAADNGDDEPQPEET